MAARTSKPSGPLLVVIPSLNTRISSDGRARLTQKFVDGMRLVSRLWAGPMAAVMFSDHATASGNLDDESYPREMLPFELRVIGHDHPDLFSAVDDADVVQFGGDHRLRALPEFCDERKIPFVFVSEYTLRTRFQIISAEVANPFLRMRRAIWECRQESHNRRAVRAASAVQCNGTPTFDIYSRLNRNTLLYFDSRIREDMIARSPAVMTRAHSFDGSKPIRLAFSGRLTRMKGADHLVEVARILNEAKFPFVMDIFGDGPVATEMHDLIRHYGLMEKVHMKGVVDFTSELVPYVRENIDLFVCCHRQGDPSCTYIETFACGVPIAGYDNEALLGIVRREPAGWATPIDNPEALAGKVMDLYQSPEELIQAASTALNFARRHTFINEFTIRTAQIFDLFKQTGNDGTLGPV
jgi:colanic acid/amylovoran biosynthesis glycosyltransferase